MPQNSDGFGRDPEAVSNAVPRPEVAASGSVRKLTPQWVLEPVGRALRKLPLDTYATAMLFTLASHANGNPEAVCWPTVETLAAETRMCPRSAQKALRTLEKAGLIRVVAEPGYHANKYHISVPPQEGAHGVHPPRAPHALGGVHVVHPEGSGSEKIQKEAQKQSAALGLGRDPEETPQTTQLDDGKTPEAPEAGQLGKGEVPPVAQLGEQKAPEAPEAGQPGKGEVPEAPEAGQLGKGEVPPVAQLGEEKAPEALKAPPLIASELFVKALLVTYRQAWGERYPHQLFVPTETDTRAARALAVVLLGLARETLGALATLDQVMATASDLGFFAVRSYLADDGRQGFDLPAQGHPLVFVKPKLKAYLRGWRKPRPAPVSAPMPATPPTPIRRYARRPDFWSASP